MLRDPRAVVASYRDWRHQGGFDLEKDPDHAAAIERDISRARRSYHPVTITLLWISAIRAAQAAMERFGSERVRIQRYEDLCRRPSEELGEVLDWLGLDEGAARVGVTVRNSSYESFQGQAGFLTSAIDRWHSTLSEPEIRVVERLAWRELAAFGYTRSSARRPPAWSCSRAYLSAAPALARALRANAHRSGNLPSYLMRRITLLLTRP